MTQTIMHVVLDEDGMMIPFHQEYTILRTKVEAWSGTNNFDGKPVTQTGIKFTYVVKVGKWRCIEDDCDFVVYTQKEAMTHHHSTYWDF